MEFRRVLFRSGSGYLKLVDDSAGYAMVFDYNGNGDATAACIFNRSQTYVTASSTCSGAALKTGYGYTTISSKVSLNSATAALGNTKTNPKPVYGRGPRIKPPRNTSHTAPM